MSVAEFSFDDRPSRGEFARWTTSLLVVLGLHAVAALALLSWRTMVDPAEPIPAAVMIELAPLPQAPPQVEPPPIVEPPPPEVFLQVEPPPEPVVVPEPEVSLPPPPKPLRKPVRHVEKPAPKLEPQPQQATPAPLPPAPTPVAPAPTPVAPPSNAMPNFQSLLLAHLDRYKQYPSAARRRREEGTVYLSFSMDRAGRVLAFKINRSSGHPALDEEVLAMIERAQPLPPIPSEIERDRLDLIVPIQFALR